MAKIISMWKGIKKSVDSSFNKPSRRSKIIKRFAFLGTMLLITVTLVATRLIAPPGTPSPELFATKGAAVCGFDDAELYPKKIAIDLDPSALNKGDTMTAKVFGKEIVIHTTGHRELPFYESWQGDVLGMDDSYFLFVRHGDDYSGVLGMEGNSFAIRGCNGRYGMALVNSESLPIEEITEAPEWVMKPDPIGACGKAQITGPVEIDILMLYTDAALQGAAHQVAVDTGDTAASRKAMEIEIAQALEVTNMAFAFSHMPIRIHLSGVEAIGEGARWETEGALNKTLRILQEEPSVQERRNRVGADLVCLIVENGLDAGYSTYFNSQGNSANRAFSVVKRNCAANQFTLAHEIGHNLGLDHQCDISTKPGAGHGFCYRLHGKRVATLMARKKGWKRLPFFSDATLKRGTLRERDKRVPCYAHDVEVLVSTAAIVANYRCGTATPMQDSVSGPAASGARHGLPNLERPN